MLSSVKENVGSNIDQKSGKTGVNPGLKLDVFATAGGESSEV